MTQIKTKKSLFLKDLVKNRYIYIMLFPVIVYYLIFHYAPMYGIVLAFKQFSFNTGFFGGTWVGLKHFKNFMSSYYFWRLLRNTALLSLYQLIFGFPAPIIFALLINEVRNKTIKKTVQTATYLPHFISVVVIVGILTEFLSSKGLINDIIVFFGGERLNLLLRPELFRLIYVGSNIWQNIGWGTIIFLAAITNIDTHLYEASTIDGAGRFKQVIHVTIPGIVPTIVILLILRIGQMMNLGWQKIILLYNPLTYETADIISSFVFRKGILEANYGFSAAVGLFNSIINLMLIIMANKFSQKVSETSLW